MTCRLFSFFSFANLKKQFAKCNMVSRLFGFAFNGLSHCLNRFLTSTKPSLCDSKVCITDVKVGGDLVCPFVVPNGLFDFTQIRQGDPDVIVALRKVGNDLDHSISDFDGGFVVSKQHVKLCQVD